MYEDEVYRPFTSEKPKEHINVDKAALRNSTDIGPAIRRQEDEDYYDSKDYGFMEKLEDLWDKIISLTPNRTKTLEQKINAITTAESMVVIEGGFLTDTEISELRKRLKNAEIQRNNSAVSNDGVTPEGMLEVQTRVYEREVADLKSKSQRIVEDILNLNLIEIGPMYVDTIDEFRPRGEALERDRKDIEKITKQARQYLENHS